MRKPLSHFAYNPLERSRNSSNFSPPIEEFSGPTGDELTKLIQESIKEFDLGEKTLATTYRRLKNLEEHYQTKGNVLFFIRESGTGKPIACSGVGSFQGLPLSEKIGEIKDLVVREDYRNRGLGSRLLYRCLREAQKIGYKRLYLETSRHMTVARKLFIQAGFEPVEELPKKDSLIEDLPCYYLFQDLQLKKFPLEVL